MASGASRSIARVTRARMRLSTGQLCVENLTCHHLPLNPFLGIDRFLAAVPRSPPIRTRASAR